MLQAGLEYGARPGPGDRRRTAHFRRRADAQREGEGGRVAVGRRHQDLPNLGSAERTQAAVRHLVPIHEGRCIERCIEEDVEIVEEFVDEEEEFALSGAHYDYNESP